MVLRILIVFLFSFSLTLAAQAEILFEGYSKIISGGEHVGYTVVRYEFDPTKKQFKSTSFLKTGPQGGDITESLKTISDSELSPISYEYTSLMGKQTKTIDAKFSKGKMTATLTEGGKKKTVRNDLPQGGFLSSNLIYLILQGKEGLQVGKRHDYSAIAEEDAQIAKGDVFVEKIEPHMGQNAYRILNRFKSIKFISYVSDKGEVLSTQSPANGIETELVAEPAMAIGRFGDNSALLKTIFGNVPAGTKNIITTSNPSKRQGVPGGQGLQIKASPNPKGPTK